MNFDLAKELADAGFPQSGEGKLIGDPNAIVLRPADRVYAPTLEELLEACGEHFSTLELVSGDDCGNEKWIANQTGHIRLQELIRGTGSAPTEAVARLWLALNKK